MAGIERALLVDAHISRGDAYIETGEFTRALSDYDQALTHDIEHRRANFLPDCPRGQTCTDSKGNIRYDAERARILSGRCRALAILGRLDEALDDCDEAVRRDPKVARAFDARGLVHLKRKDFGAALSDYSAALRIDAELASSLYGRGLAKRAAGEQAGAEADMAAAKAIDAEIEAAFARWGVKL
jgi:tetratricopeptide (TPR) repeat protein